MFKSKVTKILLFTFLCLAIGYISGMTTRDAISDWYVFLTKPPFTPPNWLFAPVWTSLYLIMGISAGVVWHQGWNRKEVKLALGIFGAHLVLNTLWTQLFFGFQTPFWAMIEIILLWISILWYSIHFYRIKKWTGLIQLPYLIWVSFASVLNAAIVYLNG